MCENLILSKCAVAIKVLIVKYADNEKESKQATAQYCYYFFFFRFLKYLEISLKKRCDNISESMPKIKIKNCSAFIFI